MLEKLLIVVMVLCSAVLQAADQPVVIYEGPAAEAPKQPQAFVADGVAHLTFGVGDKVLYSQNAGDGFSAPSVAFRVPNMSLGMRRGPRIAVAGKAIVITAIGGAQGKGKDGDVLAYRSDDLGVTWKEPVRVNDVEASAREGLHAMTASGGVLWCVWLDLRAKKTELYASKSGDGGATWSKNQLIYRSPDKSICECCHPSIVSAGDSIHILFRNSIAGNRDMYLVSSNNQGASFGQATRLGIQHWALNACPMDGGMLAIESPEKVMTVWRRSGTIYSSSNKSVAEVALGQGEQAWVAANATGTHVIWTSSRDGDLLYTKLGSDAQVAEPDRISMLSRDPVIVTESPTSKTAHVFWEQRTDHGSSINWKSITGN